MAQLIDRLWTRYRGERDECARRELLEQYIGLVHHAARDVARMVPKDLEFDELISAGTVGLVQALEGFDPSRGLAFSTYAVPRIRGAILDEVRSWDWVPRSVRDRTRQVGQAQNKLRTNLGREPEPEEVAATLDVDLRTYKRWLEGSEGPTMLSLDQKIDSGRSTEMSLADVMADPSTTGPQLGLEQADSIAALHDAIAALSKKDQIVLALIYYEGLSQRQIAQALHVTESRVSQIHSRLLVRLRECLGLAEVAR